MSSPPMSNPGVTNDLSVWQVYRLLNDTRHDLRCIELREGELFVYDAKSLSQVEQEKSRVSRERLCLN